MLAQKLRIGATGPIAALALFSLTGSALALQNPPSPEQRLEQLTERLHLDVQQTAKVNALMAQSRARRQALLARYGLTDEKLHALLDELRDDGEDTREALDDILTRRQRHALRGMMWEHGERGERPGPPLPPADDHDER